MYVRQAKQFLRNVDATFDERKFGFGNVTDLFRACQREGLFRVERDRQGVIRLFPGNVMQPIGVAGVTRATDEDDDNRGNVADPAAPLDDVSEEAAGEPDVVEGDVVREIETPQVVDGVEAAAPSEAQPPARGGRGRGRAKAPGLPRSTEGRKPRKSPAEGAAPRVKRAAAKPRAPRAKPKVESPP
jgi:hypothetical protein